jgi:hypothetical protein
MRIALATLLAVALAGDAAAQTCDAKAHYDRATAAYGLSRFNEAGTEFEAAYECKPQPALLFDAAQAHRQGGNKQRALELFENYLHVYGPTATNGADVQKIIDQLRVETAPPPTPPPAAPVVTTNEGVTATAPPPVERKPIYKRAWFWGAVAGGVVVLGVVIGVSAAYGTRTKDPMPSIGTWAF